jgi:hypothetical protein
MTTLSDIGHDRLCSATASLFGRVALDKERGRSRDGGDAIGDRDGELMRPLSEGRKGEFDRRR